MTDVFLIGDTSSRTNWGCRATTAALRALIEERATLSARLDVSRFATPLAPDEVAMGQGSRPSSPSRLAALKRSWALERAATLAAVRRPELLAWRPALLRGITWSEVPRLAELIGAGRLLPKVRDAIASADVVVINGEGSFLQRRFPGRLKLLLAYTARVVMDTPCALVNHTADVRDPVMWEMSEHVYPHLDDVRFREPISAEQVGKLCRPGTFGIAGDAAFALGPNEPIWNEVARQPGYAVHHVERVDGFEPTAPYICLGGSSVYLAESRQGFDPVRSYRDLYHELSAIAPVILTAASHPDDTFLQEVARVTGAPYFGLDVSTLRAADLLASAAAYVGGRWHPAILASTGGTPVTMFSANTPHKSEGFVRLLPMAGPTHSAFEIDAHVETIADRVKAQVESGVPLRSEVRARAEELALTARSNVHILTDR